MIGEWVLERKERPDASWNEGDDTFTFEKVLDGAGILSEWYFNRGTPEGPNYTRNGNVVEGVRYYKGITDGIGQRHH